MNFTDLSNGVSEGYCIVKTVEQKLNVKGVPYLDLVLSDADGEINAKLWDYKDQSDSFGQGVSRKEERGSTVPSKWNFTALALSRALR